MPIDAQIPLQAKAPVIPQLDFNATFRTLGQLRSANATAQAKEAEAERAAQLFAETGAGRQLLSSLRTTPPSAAPPGPVTGGPPFDEATLAALPPGASTAPAAPAPRQRSILDPEVQAELYRIAPHAADDLLKTGLATHTTTLQAQQALYESVARSMPASGGEESYQAWRAMAGTVLPPDVTARLPAHDPGPAFRTEMQRNAQNLDTQFKQQIEASTAETARMDAKTRAQTEQRTGRKVLLAHGEQGDVPIWEYPPEGVGIGGPGGPGPVGTPGTGPIPGTERPRTGEENLAAARLQQAARANGRLAQIEAEIASGGTDPTTDPRRDTRGVYLPDPTGEKVGVGINQQTPAEREREIQQYLANTPTRWERSVLDTAQGPRTRDASVPADNAPNTYTGKGLIRVVPSVLEHSLAHHTGALGATAGAVGGAVAGAASGARVGGPGGATAGAVGGATTGARAGGALGESLGGDIAHTRLDPRRQAYNSEQDNFIAAIKGDNLSADGMAFARKQYFPSPGDTEAEVLRKRAVRDEAVSGLATQTNRPQGMVPRGQTQMPPPGARTYSMEQAFQTAKATGRTIDDVLADAKRQGIVIR